MTPRPGYWPTSKGILRAATTNDASGLPRPGSGALDPAQMCLNTHKVE